VPVAVTKNIPVLPTVTVSLAGFDVIDGGEFDGGGLGDGGGVGFVGGGEGNGEDTSIFSLRTIPEHPEKNKTGITRSV
jgi:hypothetical protein